jgi:DNA-binding CsgD family transcriptional regulator
MSKESIERLTARHRDCLRLVASNHSTKEIAIALKISPNTVDGYISEAKEIIGVPTRRDAARAFLAFNAAHDPQNLGAKFSRVAFSSLEQSSVERVQEVGLLGVASSNFGERSTLIDSEPKPDSFHWFRGEREHNSLTVHQRLVWIATGSVVAALIFVAALASIDTLARLLSQRTP